MTMHHSGIFPAFKKGWLAWWLSAFFFVVLTASTLPALASTVTFTGADADGSTLSFTRQIGGVTFTFSAAGYLQYYAAGDNGVGWPDGLYPGDYTVNGNNIMLTVTIQSGYTFDLTGFAYAVDHASGVNSVDLGFTSGGTPYTDPYTVTTNGSSGLTTVSSLTHPVNDVTQVTISASGYGQFQNLQISDIRAIGTPTYTVTYNGNGNNGGTAPTDSWNPYPQGASVTVLGNTGSLAKSGYLFTGWNTASDGSGTSYAPGATLAVGTANVILYAQWVAAPTVSSVSPTSGPTAGGTSVTVTGTNLTGATAVKFGSTNASSYTVNSATNITATSPAGSAGTVNITVTTAGGTSITGASDQFTYVAAPTVASISVSNGSTAGGTSVTITGTNLTGATAVKFGSTNASSYTVNSATSITATSPASSAGTVDITVTTAGGTSATGTSDQFTYKLSQTITFANPGSQNFGTTPTLTASATSGLTPAFTSSTTGVCTITSGGALTFATTGTCTINADQTGNGSYLAAGTVTQSFSVVAVTPGAPVIGTATAGDTQASVAFTAPASNGGATITGYTVTSNSGGLTGTGASSPITVTGLTNGTAYTFTVTATNSAGTGSASAASNSVTPKGSQTITFNNPGAQNFGTTPSLTASATSGLTPTFTSSTTGVCTITSGGALTFATTGTCTINADQAGNGSYLAASTVTQSFTVNAVVPGAPVIGTATAGDTQASVAFTAPASNGGATITGYTVTSNPGGLTGTGASSPITVTGLTNGVSYTFTVTATNSAGTGSASAASNSVTPNSGPAVVSVAVPANGSYAAGGNLDFTVTWDSAVTVTGTPRIAITIGTATVYAAYQSGSGTTATLFRYTVLSGQTDTDGITVGTLTLGGGTIQNSSNINATLTLNSVGSTTSVLVDTTAPILPAANIVVNNQSDPHKVVLTFNEALSIGSIGSAGAWAVAANGGPPAYSIAGVALTGANQVTLTLSPVDVTNAATTITNAAATAHLRVTPPATLTDVAGNSYAAGQVTEAGATHVLDTTAPTLGNVSSGGANNNGGTLAATASEKARGYWIAVASGAAMPTAAQVMAGTAYGGVTAVVSGNGTLPAGSAGSLTVKGLTANTAYDLYLVAEDAAGNLTAVVSSAAITTAAARVVTTASDSGAGSLRQAIIDATPGDTITFAPGLNGQTITLVSTLAITKDLTISGPGAGQLTISGNGAVQPFQVGAATMFSLEKLTVANGAAANGGALSDSATSTTAISGCAFSNNSATSDGGAIHATGTMTISATLFDGNSATADGGAIHNAGGTLSLTNVTLAANDAANGGGISTTGGTTAVTDATIAGNSSTVQGGGLDIAGGALSLKNSIVANNTAPSGADILGTVTSLGYNLVRDTGSAAFTATAGDLTGQDPLLGALAANGGPTRTMALLSGSPAMDAGTCAGAPPADQRGMTRPQNGLCDMGAYERGVPATLTATGGTPQSAAINATFATPLTATVADSLGGALNGINVAFGGPASGAGIVADGSGATDTSGSATFTATANATTGAYTVTATVNSLTTGFSLTNTTLAQSIGAITFTPPTLTVGATATVSATATSGLPVVFSSTTPAVCTVSGAIVTGISAGTCTIAANQGGDAAYTPAPQATQNITVSNKAGQTITFGPPPALVVGGTGTVSATATSGLAVVFSSTTPAVCTVSGAVVTGINTGTCTIAANQGGNAAYNSAPQATQNITVTVPLSLTVSALLDGAVTADATQNVSGMVTNPAYLRTLTINGASITVATDGSFSYPVQLVEGANTIAVVATTTSGGVVNDTRTITLDNSALRLAVTYPPDNKAVIQQAITVTGTIAELFSGSSAAATTTVKSALAAADPTMVVSYTVNGSAPGTATLSDTAYSFTVNLAAGMNTIQVSAVNGAGKTAQAKRTVTYQPAFSLSVSDPATDIRTVQTSYLLKGIVADNSTPVTVTVTVDGRTYTPPVDGTTGAFQQQLTFTGSKVYQVNVTAVDRNNATVSVPRNIVAVAAAPGSAFTIVDALLALKMSVGLLTPDRDQTLRFDVAPLVNGASVGDGRIDIEDTIVILRKAVGLL